MIVLPSDASEWAEADLRRALVHELEHARRGDWATQLARSCCMRVLLVPPVGLGGLAAAVPRSRARGRRRRGSECGAYRVRGAVSVTFTAAFERSRAADTRHGESQRLVETGFAGFVLIAIAPLRAVARSTNLAAAKQESRMRTDDTGKSGSAPFDRTLFDAAEKGNTSDINRVLNSGANVDCALEGDGSPLIAAARNGHRAAVELLLERGADPNMPVPGDGNPLIMASRAGHAVIVVLLLDRGANIDQIDPGDENALIQASSRGHLDSREAACHPWCERQCSRLG